MSIALKVIRKYLNEVVNRLQYCHSTLALNRRRYVLNEGKYGLHSCIHISWRSSINLQELQANMYLLQNGYPIWEWLSELVSISWCKFTKQCINKVHRCECLKEHLDQKSYFILLFVFDILYLLAQLNAMFNIVLLTGILILLLMSYKLFMFMDFKCALVKQLVNFILFFT